MSKVFKTSFGMYCPCDLETYKKYKKVRNFIEITRGQNNRFRWFWRKEPQNRICKIMRTPVEEPALFTPFFVKKERDWGRFNYNPEVGPIPKTDQYKYIVECTDLYLDFIEDYNSARCPRATPEEVRPLSIEPALLDYIILQYEEYLTNSKIHV